MQQRTQSLLAIVTVLAMFGGAVALASTGGAVAQATGQTQVAQDTFEVSSGSGIIHEINVGVSGHVEWEGLPADAESVEVAMRLTPEEIEEDPPYMERDREAFPVEENQTFQIDGGTSGEYAVENVSLPLTDGLYTASGFPAREDNSTQHTQVEVDIVLIVTDAEGNTVNHTERHRIRVVAQNEPAPEPDPEPTANGSASLSIATDVCPVSQCGEASPGGPGNGNINRFPEPYDPDE